MLLALEVAVEYWLALSWSPQAQWLSGSGSSSALKDEVHIVKLLWLQGLSSSNSVLVLINLLNKAACKLD